MRRSKISPIRPKKIKNKPNTVQINNIIKPVIIEEIIREGIISCLKTRPIIAANTKNRRDPPMAAEFSHPDKLNCLKTRAVEINEIAAAVNALRAEFILLPPNFLIFSG